MTDADADHLNYRLGAGFHPNLPKNEYLADPCHRPSLSSSIASLLLQRSPAHAFAAHPRLGGHRSDPTEAMLKGSLLDSLLCGGDAEIIESPYDEYRTKEAREWRDAQSATGKLAVKRKDLEYAKKAADYIRENLLSLGVELTGQPQTSAIWESNGVLCRGRFDYWNPSEALLIDLKTCDSAAPGGLGNKFVSFGYAVQWAAYVQAIETLIPELQGRVRMIFACAETEAPYACTVATLGGTMRAFGQWQWKRAVETWGRCLESKQWPAYGETEVEAPAWAVAAMEAGMLEGGSLGAPF